MLAEGGVEPGVCDAAIGFFEANAKPSERFRFTLDRVGREEFRFHSGLHVFTASIIVASTAITVHTLYDSIFT